MTVLWFILLTPAVVYLLGVAVVGWRVRHLVGSLRYCLLAGAVWPLLLYEIVTPLEHPGSESPSHPMNRR